MEYFEDFQIGEKIITRGRTVTEADIVSFAAFSGDWYPLHTDIEFARKSQFEERIAHGMLVLSLTSGLWSPEYVLRWAFIAFYGMDKVRFVAPTKIGDTLHVEMEVIDKQDKDEHSGIVSWRESIKNQREEDVAVCIMKVLIAKKK
jgi:acyl dehydratase